MKNETKRFIGITHESTGTFDSPSILLRKGFFLNKVSGKYLLRVCGLGFGVYYVNGKVITEDVFITPVSDYNKTLWYTEYDVTDLVCSGQNLICAELGNGFYNENFETSWGYHKAEWRDTPCLWAELFENDKCILKTDESWKGKASAATYYNQLRSGEYFDSRRMDDWISSEYSDNDWTYARFAVKQPRGVFRSCTCPPIREFDRLSPISIAKNENGYIFDFGLNRSGYVELDVTEEAGTELTLRYSEEIDGNNDLNLNNCNCYQGAPFQVDKIICNGNRIIWKPKFTYHGFRYLEICGLKSEPTTKTATAIFTHQALDSTSEFSSSDETLNKIWDAGLRSTLSNTFYSLTDCPTREKLGWLNDAQASMAQVLLNFDSKAFFKKWIVDICDTMNDEGNISGIAPTPNWGYDWGVVTGGIIITLPYMLYKYTGDTEALRYAMPYMKHYYKYHCEHIGDSFLGDWNGSSNLPTPVIFIDELYRLIFANIFTDLTPEEAEDHEFYLNQSRLFRAEFISKYITNGRCVIDEQVAVCACIVLELGEKNELREQLIKLLKRSDNHIYCGMVGIQFLYKALLKLGESELWLDVILNDTPPSFKVWIEGGATTLYETFDENAHTISRNHHMFSNVIQHFTENILGITVMDASQKTYAVNPIMTTRLTFANGGIRIPDEKNSSIYVEWDIKDGKRTLRITASGDAIAIYRTERITAERTFCECITNT